MAISLEVELSLVHLRVLHTVCEGQRQQLVLALVETGREPLLRSLLDALQPAVYVLAEVGIMWGDEFVSLEVGQHTVNWPQKRCSRKYVNKRTKKSPG